MATKSDAPLDDLMMAMDVVDTLRHEERQVARELGADERDAAMIERLRGVYASQGIEVPDHILKAGVEDLKRDRFVYAPPAAGFGRTLALIYITRNSWSKWLAAGLTALVLAAGIWYFAIALPNQRAEAALAARLEALPQTLGELVTRIDGLTDRTEIEENARSLAQNGRLGLEDGKVEAAFKAEADLREISAKLTETFEIRIISRPGEPTGLTRIPQSNPEAENFYIVVEAVDPDGTVLNRQITSEESGETGTVSKWAQRVSETIFNAVRQDKTDDGIVQDQVLGEKRRGNLDINWRTGVGEGAIYQWK